MKLTFVFLMAVSSAEFKILYIEDIQIFDKLMSREIIMKNLDFFFFDLSYHIYIVTVFPPSVGKVGREET